MANFNRQHAYQAALAADEAGRLRRYVGSLAYRPSPVSATLTTTVGTLGFANTAARLRRAALQLSPACDLVRIPAPEVVERFIASTGVARGVSTQLRAAAFDRLAARYVATGRIFHGFEQCSALCLERASKHGSICILDQSILAWPTLVERRAQAFARHSVTLPPANGTLARRHVQRKVRERLAADYFLAGLADVRDSLVSAGVSTDRIFILPYGATLTEEAFSERSQCHTPVRLLYVGHQSWQKGLPDLLRELRGSAVAFELQVVGRLDPLWESVLKEYAADCEESGNRVLFRQPIPQRELLSLYGWADILVFPSLIGGVGLATLEAMAAGVPIITSDPDIMLIPGVDCLVAEQHKPGSIVEQIRVLALSPQLYRSMSRAGIGTARRFSWEAYSAGLAEVYQIVAAEGSADSFTAPSLRR